VDESHYKSQPNTMLLPVVPHTKSVSPERCDKCMNNILYCMKSSSSLVLRVLPRPFSSDLLGRFRTRSLGSRNSSTHFGFLTRDTCEKSEGRVRYRQQLLRPRLTHFSRFGGCLQPLEGLQPFLWGVWCRNTQKQTLICRGSQRTLVLISWAVSALGRWGPGTLRPISAS